MLTKILANRLKIIIGKIIDEKQPAFISGIQILEEILIPKEIVEDATRNRKKISVIQGGF